MPEEDLAARRADIMVRLAQLHDESRAAVTQAQAALQALEAEKPRLILPGGYGADWLVTTEAFKARERAIREVAGKLVSELDARGEALRLEVERLLALEAAQKRKLR